MQVLGVADVKVFGVVHALKDVDVTELHAGLPGRSSERSFPRQKARLRFQLWRASLRSSLPRERRLAGAAGLEPVVQDPYNRLYC